MSSSQQQVTAIPRLDTQFVDPLTGMIQQPWYRLLIDLWRKNASSLFPITESVYFLLNSNGAVGCYRVDDNALLGFLFFSGGTPPPPQPVPPSGSGFVYQAQTVGTLIVDSGMVELSRDGSTWYIVSRVGGAIPMQVGDFSRVSWFEAPPTITFFPI